MSTCHTLCLSNFTLYYIVFAGKDYVTMISGRTLDNTNMPVAFAISQADSSDTMNKLYEFSRRNGVDIDQPDFILLSDRGSAVLKHFSQTYKHMHHMYCQKHLAGNLVEKGWKTHLGLYWEAAR